MADPSFAFRDFGRWQSKARAHGNMGSRYRVAACDAAGAPIEAVLLCPDEPSRAQLQSARYDRLAPSIPDDSLFEGLDLSRSPDIYAEVLAEIAEAAWSYRIIPGGAR